jgi:ribosomal protein S18 acetylase RimI-like enzyme
MLDIRPIDPDADLEALFAIAYACDALAVPEPETTRADVHNLLTSPQADLASGSRKVLDGDRTVGFVVVEVDVAGRTVFLDGYVAPGRGDEAWDALFAHGSDFAETYAAAIPAQEAAEWTLAAGCYADDVRYSSVLERWGLRRVRRFHRMEIVFDDASTPTPPTPPEGVTLVTTGDDEGLLRTAHAVLEDAFEGAWKHLRRPYDEFIDYCRNESFAPAQWWIAFVDGAPAAICLGNDHLAELGLGYVGMLGVRPEYRGRGLATLLLRQAFAQAHALGRRGVRLGVDSENDTGALQLYTSVGMRQVEAIDAWRRPLVRGATAR